MKLASANPLSGLIYLARTLGDMRETPAGEIMPPECERWLLWAPGCVALGVAGYFLLAVEPPLWLGPC
jgi:hypothetical protein